MVGVVTNKVSALLISNSLADFLVAMARAGIVDHMAVTGVTNSAVHMALHNPEALLPIIEGFGGACELIQERYDLSERDSLRSAHELLIENISQLERAGLRPGVKTKVRTAAGRARRKAKGSKRRS